MKLPRRQRRLREPRWNKRILQSSVVSLRLKSVWQGAVSKDREIRRLQRFDWNQERMLLAHVDTLFAGICYYNRGKSWPSRSIRCKARLLLQRKAGARSSMKGKSAIAVNAEKCLERWDDHCHPPPGFAVMCFFDVFWCFFILHISPYRGGREYGYPRCKELCFELTIPINASIPCESILLVCEYICSKENWESYIGMKSLFKYCTMCFCRDV